MIWSQFKNTIYLNEDIVPDDKIVLDIDCGSTDPDRVYVGIFGECEDTRGMKQGYDGIWRFL